MSQQRRIYLDNAATSFPKPEVVYDAVDRYQRKNGAPAGRGAYTEALQTQKIVERCRQRAAMLFRAKSLHQIQFAFNGTDALNIALHGLLKPGDHVITSVVEHNSVLRPLRALKQRVGIDVTYVEANETGKIDPADVKSAICSQTKLIVLIHASNVTGTIQPVEEVAEIAAKANIFFLLDAAQSAGHLPINIEQLPVDLLACPGHKGLLGPLGTGLLYIKPGVEKHLTSFRQGGTGSHSEEEQQPTSLPDKYESGNHNVLGIVGLDAALGWLEEEGIETLRQHEIELTNQLMEGFASIEKITQHGTTTAEERLGVVSISVANWEPQVLASLLDESFGIQTRAGLHCSPRIHRSLGTLERGGTIRFSLGAFTTKEEIEITVNALRDILR
ncbi:Cysteine desulfurase [hydrothermal vent metagenome]|uniref:cysteine desulfurase n=1 Tax=hydrothermal vent metagenome TaxID=652676 RepID=A0A3B1DW58_9ZZZZ